MVSAVQETIRFDTLCAGHYQVLFESLKTKIKALGLPKGSLTPFFSNYSTGGIFGIVAFGPTAAASENLKVSIAILKSLAVPGDITSSKVKVSNCSSVVQSM